MVFGNIYNVANRENAKHIFENWDETIIWSCLQGVMGHIYADDKENPASAMAILGDFCFYAGRPSRKLVAFKPEWCSQDFIIAVPRSREWAEVIEEHYGDRAKRVTRYAMKKEKHIFDRDALTRVVARLSPEYTLHSVDEGIFHDCKKADWSRDFVSQFPDWKAYQKAGLGVVIKKDGLIISGASSYSAYAGGIEIEIDTKKEYRRRGLALVSGARLILACLDRGLYPSWDAQNTWSVSLAEKLGYHFHYEYDAYEIFGY